MNLSSPLSGLRGVGPARQKELRALGLETVEDLLGILPRAYEDWRHVRLVADVSQEGEALFRGRLIGLRTLRTRKKNLTLVRGNLEDGSGRIPAVWFNRPYLSNQIDAASDYLVHGQVRRRGGNWELLNPSISRVDAGDHGKIRPIYPPLGSIGPKTVQGWMVQILEALPEPLPIEDPLPKELSKKYGLPDLGDSLRAVHDPAGQSDSESLSDGLELYRARMAYGELLELQLVLARSRSSRAALAKGHRYRVDDDLRQEVREMLPFSLTHAQKQALREIVDDLLREGPMGRLLQGDVGSGKTIVAAIAILIAAANGLQAAFMAPTEVLAKQQYETLTRWLGKRYRVGLLTGSTEDSESTREALKQGRIRVIVGTHALIQGSVQFRDLALVVVDEQHRFGVTQRQALCQKGERPDLLVMTATPIPRSLAMTVWGDLERSVIDELPPGRQPITTEIVERRSRAKVYRQARAALVAGERLFVVLPRIDHRDDSDLASIERDGEQIRSWLEPHPVAIAHGRLSAPELAEVLKGFAEGDVSALIATTVIEVGIDIPEASIMVIESGEQFGLAQLHQLRGRVGRGPSASRCIVVQGKSTPEGVARLEAFRATSNGFELAEQDLALRGPGDLLGLRQAGTPFLETADLVQDRIWLERAHRDAERLKDRLHEPGLASLLSSVERRARQWRRIRSSESSS